MKSFLHRLSYVTAALFVAQTVFITGCSQPILESRECIASRDSVKRFYSFHIGNKMDHSAKNLEVRSKFLSGRLGKELELKPDAPFDYFTQTNSYPKAFRAGKCETLDGGRTSFDILLFWRTDDQDVQRLINVEAINENSRWLIDRVTAIDQNEG